MSNQQWADSLIKIFKMKTSNILYAVQEPFLSAVDHLQLKLRWAFDNDLSQLETFRHVFEGWANDNHHHYPCLYLISCLYKIKQLIIIGSFNNVCPDKSGQYFCSEPVYEKLNLRKSAVFEAREEINAGRMQNK